MRLYYLYDIVTGDIVTISSVQWGFVSGRKPVPVRDTPCWVRYSTPVGTIAVRRSLQ